MDTGVDAGVLGIRAAQAPGDDAAELLLEDHPAPRVPGAAVLAGGAGAESGARQGVPIPVGRLADILPDELDLHCSQLGGRTGVLGARDAPAGDAHVVAGAPLHPAEGYGPDVVARHGTLQPDHAHVHVERGVSVAGRNKVLGHAAHHATLGELGHPALDGHPARLVAAETVRRRHHVHGGHQGAAAVEGAVVAQVQHVAAHRGLGGGGAAYDAWLHLLSG